MYIYMHLLLCYYYCAEVIQIMSGQGSYQLIHNPLCNGDSSDEEDQPTEGWPDEVCVCVCVCACVFSL